MMIKLNDGNFVNLKKVCHTTKYSDGSLRLFFGAECYKDIKDPEDIEKIIGEDKTQEMKKIVTELRNEYNIMKVYRLLDLIESL
jgi:hypothetical protein